MKKRPNYIIFITDQQRADWLGCYGHPVVQTPNIDVIAGRGTRFTNFHVASPVCMPNRASLLTGRYPSVHGLRTNGCLLPERANTFVDVLADAGYRTASIGKSHLQPFLDQEAPSQNRPETGAISEAWKPEQGDYTQEQSEHFDSSERYAFKTPYYGYQHVDMVTGHGDHCGGHYRQWFRKNAPNWQDLINPKNELPHSYRCPQAYRTPVPPELYPTFYIRDRAVDFLLGADDEAPFFLFISFPDPHHPFNPPGKYWDMYSPDLFDLPLPFEAHQNPTPPMRHLHNEWINSDASGGLSTSAFMTNEREIREAMALTAGMISMIDDAVGSIMEALETSGRDDNTVVCFTSDHGDYLGDYNMLLKGALPLRSITRVPFIWSDPAARSGNVCEDLASTIDISATVLERSDLKPYMGIQGRSFLNGIYGHGLGRDELLIEYNDALPRMGFEDAARVRALVTNQYRLTIYKDQDWGELYDLSSDPAETQNLWFNSNYADLKSELTMRLAHQLLGQMDESPAAQRLA